MWTLTERDVWDHDICPKVNHLECWPYPVFHNPAQLPCFTSVPIESLLLLKIWLSYIYKAMSLRVSLSLMVDRELLTFAEYRTIDVTLDIRCNVLKKLFPCLACTIQHSLSYRQTSLRPLHLMVSSIHFFCMHLCMLTQVLDLACGICYLCWISPRMGCYECCFHVWMNG